MTDETTLLSCPFCGGEARLVNDYSSEKGMSHQIWHECTGHEGRSGGYGQGVKPFFETPWYATDVEAIAAWNTRAELGSEINGDTSDGYHTFNELYHHRAVLFSVIVRDHRELAWKARKHHDGTMYEGMFIVGIETPKGQATYHYDLDPYWEMFDCEEREYAPEWDGHTPDDAIARIAELGSGTCEVECFDDGVDEGLDGEWFSYAPPTWYLSCGHTSQGTEKPNFCPSCGRKVE